MTYLRLHLSILLVVIASCSSSVTNNDAHIHFENEHHNFSALSYKHGAEYAFQFSNPGNTPLIIFDVKTSCGCTVPKWPKKPVKPNKTGEIRIKYDAASPGVFYKTIQVYYNGKDSPQKLTIKGEVEYPDDLKETDNEK
jgi:hypothetical protein